MIVPHISTVEDAKAVVRSVKYPPMGDRSSCPSIRSAHFGLLSWEEYYQKANEDNLVSLIIEGEEGIKNTPDIVKVPGVDSIIFGPVDFSQAIGLPGATFEHPKLYAALKDMAKICNEAGVALMTTTSPLSSVAAGRRIADAGVRVIMLSIDEIIFRQACQELIKIKEYL